MYPTKNGSIDDASASDWNAANKPTTKTFNQVERPEHYNQDDGIECIDAIKAQLTHDEFIGYIRGTIAKYNWRMMNKHPNPIQDASKIRWFSAYLEQYLLTSPEARS
jgi:hypothetical protein